MDLAGIVLGFFFEISASALDLLIDILMYVLVTASNFDLPSNLTKHITPLIRYTSTIAYLILGSAVLVMILKKLITDDDLDLTEGLFRLIVAAVTVALAPLLIDYMASKTGTIVNEMLSKIEVSIPDTSKINLVDLIQASSGFMRQQLIYGNIVMATMIISLIAMVVLFIQSLFYLCMLVIAKIIAPIMGLGVLSYNFDLFILFLKDVAGIYITRILQLVLIKLSFVLILGAFADSFSVMLSPSENIGAAEITVVMNILTGAVLMITLIFLPSFIKKYITTSGMGSAAKSAAGGAAAALKKGATGGAA